MRDYDKELVINGEVYRSPEQQVYKNMEDIKALKLKIKDWYSCSTELNTTDVSVARTNTNVPNSVSEGFLLDTGGKLFSITGGDEDNLLLYYYATIKGAQGEQGPSGAELEIDDSGTSATKVWSSQKVSTELANAGKNYYVHHISFERLNSFHCEFEITNSSADEINTFAKICNVLPLSGFTGANDIEVWKNYIRATGYKLDSGNYAIYDDGHTVCGVCRAHLGGYDYIEILFSNVSILAQSYVGNAESNITSISDDVRLL